MNVRHGTFDRKLLHGPNGWTRRRTLSRRACGIWCGCWLEEVVLPAGLPSTPRQCAGRVHSHANSHLAVRSSVFFIPLRRQSKAVSRSCVLNAHSSQIPVATLSHDYFRFAGSYCTDTTRSSRDRDVDGILVTYTAIFARPCRSNGNRKRSSTAPNTGIAKLKGSKAKKPKASVAGSNQVGRFGCRSASHSSRRSFPLIRHSLNILRIMSSLGFGYLRSTSCIESRSVWIAFVRWTPFFAGDTYQVVIVKRQTMAASINTSAPLSNTRAIGER
jgi:hypothetical protein